MCDMPFMTRLKLYLYLHVDKINLLTSLKEIISLSNYQNLWIYIKIITLFNNVLIKLYNWGLG